KKVYGMQIGQYYYSSDYRDKGYLFLMFDLENPDEPKIMVRSWQPEKAEDGSIIGVSDFQFD
ncbi:MAG: nuclear transport factor 2 family protein, partial [Candidatus Cloacimonadota bacterium]